MERGIVFWDEENHCLSVQCRQCKEESHFDFRSKPDEHWVAWTVANMIDGHWVLAQGKYPDYMRYWFCCAGCLDEYNLVIGGNCEN